MVCVIVPGFFVWGVGVVCIQMYRYKTILGVKKERG